MIWLLWKDILMRLQSNRILNSFIRMALMIFFFFFNLINFFFLHFTSHVVFTFLICSWFCPQLAASSAFSDRKTGHKVTIAIVLIKSFLHYSPWATQHARYKGVLIFRHSFHILFNHIILIIIEFLCPIYSSYMLVLVSTNGILCIWDSKWFSHLTSLKKKESSCT